jgi:hypothetical protein
MGRRILPPAGGVRVPVDCGGIIRGLSGAAGVSTQRFNLGEPFLMGEKGSQFDLTSERENIESDISSCFIGLQARGT